MNLVVLNAGSGSQRCTLFRLPDRKEPAEPPEPAWQAKLDATAPDQPEGQLEVRIRRGREEAAAGVIAAASDTHQRTQHLLRRLWEGDAAPLRRPEEIDVVGHRVVHGGEQFQRAVPVDAAVAAAIEELAALAPLHNPANLAGIRATQRLLPAATPQVAVFDTAFHHTLSEAAATYAGPWEWREQGIRRYGFHGTNYRWVSERAAHLLGRIGDPHLALIVCHLGGGASLCAMRGGRSLATTMGFTPLDGIAMCTRAGSVDPGILLHLLRRGVTVDDLEATLNRRSGLLGLSGISGDTRVLRPRLKAGDPAARRAWDVYVLRIREALGGLLGVLGSAPDAVVFTDAIGETEPGLRGEICAPFRFLGLELNAARNAASPVDADIAAAGASVRALIIKSREAWQIARECLPFVRAR